MTRGMSRSNKKSFSAARYYVYHNPELWGLGVCLDLPNPKRKDKAHVRACDRRIRKVNGLPVD